VRFRIEHLILTSPLNLPGQGSAKKWQVARTSAFPSNNQVCFAKSIVETSKGYRLHIPVGANKGFYNISDDKVAFAKEVEVHASIIDGSMDHDGPELECAKCAEDQATAAVVAIMEAQRAETSKPQTRKAKAAPAA
jgi:hypothetical protein